MAKKLKKPLLIGEFGKLKPISVRNRFLNTVHEALYEAIAEGLPIAGNAFLNTVHCPLFEFLGTLFWMIGDQEYEDYDGFTIFPKDQALEKKRQQTSTPVEVLLKICDLFVWCLG